MDFLNLWITRSYWNQTSFVRYSNTRLSQWNWNTGKWIIVCFHGKKFNAYSISQNQRIRSQSEFVLHLSVSCFGFNYWEAPKGKRGSSVEQLYNKLFENVRMYIPTYIFWFKWSTCNYEKRNNFTLDIYGFILIFI